MEDGELWGMVNGLNPALDNGTQGPRHLRRLRDRPFDNFLDGRGWVRLGKSPKTGLDEKFFIKPRFLHLLGGEVVTRGEYNGGYYNPKTSAIV